MDEISARDQAQLRDPERRWLRHTFQEGPGFRFLATRGGRPPEHQRRRGQIAAVRARARAVRIAREDGLAVVLDSGTISRTTLWRWLCAYERAGLAALVPERRGPRNPALTHPAWLEQVVITVRLHTYWNAKRISAELRRREIADVGHRWISQLLDDLSRGRSSSSSTRAVASSRPGSSAWSMTTPASSSACASRPTSRADRSSCGCAIASSCAACRWIS